ncbi:Glucose/arabinose dehydrogenase, beta-propeller fold [Loktanella atrilutea]|uniref:Glucose/arabinose dehydrogenase, beta-propeller fold n=1 Tax=Loktanella atrilutea TaxID=366533 RepID=A0A1M4YW75_LOKAT|nr:PQQ-dependent sugar dehydrogenase [Loktanella atrilutea]SHF09958.1 Glucose/arabinose dehydrogenase, beta-propeller fold [Loktanella atrilutea]
MRTAAFIALIPTLSCAQVDQGPRNADFNPAFENQTRAPALPDTPVAVSTFAEGLANPWGIAALPDGTFLVTERSGTLRRISADGALSDPIGGVPQVDAKQQGGLLDVAIAPDFVDSSVLYLTYAKGVEGGTVTAAARAVLDGDKLTDVKDIFVQDPPADTYAHYGSRVVPTPDGKVFITTGEHFTENNRQLAQDINTTYGKTIRLNADGSVPQDNPFVGRDGVDGIWSYGHRNVQGATLGPDGTLWTMEHGPAGGDELNHPQAGLNYGWPVISYGVNYDGSPVGSGKSAMEGMEQPVYYWDPVIAPGGMAFYDGDYADWQGDLLIAGLNPGSLTRLRLDGNRVAGEERLLQDVGRIRDVEVLNDGDLLILIDADPGQVLRVNIGG